MSAEDEKKGEVETLTDEKLCVIYLIICIIFSHVFNMFVMCLMC